MAHSSSRRCQSWFDRAKREASREEYGPDLAQRHVADQRLEVLATAHSRAGLAEVPVEDPDPLRAPAQRLSFARQIVLAFGALLVEANLAHGRLTNVDAGLPRQMSIGNLGDHRERLPPG